MLLKVRSYNRLQNGKLDQWRIHRGRWGRSLPPASIAVAVANVNTALVLRGQTTNSATPTSAAIQQQRLSVPRTIWFTTDIKTTQTAAGSSKSVSFFGTTVCKTVRPMLSDRCLSCLSVTLVYCGQMLGWIKMPLRTNMGICPDHIVLDGNPAPPPSKRGTAAQFSANVYCGQTVTHLSCC